MIQNPTIIEKLEEKTSSDNLLQEFLKTMLERESEGKYSKKSYENEIANRSKERKEKAL